MQRQSLAYDPDAGLLMRAWQPETLYCMADCIGHSWHISSLGCTGTISVRCPGLGTPTGQDGFWTCSPLNGAELHSPRESSEGPRSFRVRTPREQCQSDSRCVSRRRKRGLI